MLLKTENTLAARIRKLRKNQGLSQAKLAKIIKISPGNLGDWEREYSAPGAKALIALSDFFGVSVDWILKGKDTSEFKDPFLPVKQIKKLIKLLMAVSVEEREELILLMDFNAQYLTARKYLQLPVPVMPKKLLTVSEEQSGYFPEDLFKNKRLIIEVTSDSMLEAGFNVGDLIVIDTGAEVQEGDTGLFEISGKIILRKKQVHNQKLQLVSGNKKYPPLTIEKIKHLVIWGKCIKHLPKTKANSRVWQLESVDNLIK